MTVNLGVTNSATATLDTGRRTSAAVVPPPESVKQPDPPAELGGVDRVFQQLRSLSEGNQPTGGLSGGAGGMGVAAEPKPIVPSMADSKHGQTVHQTGVKPFVTNGADLTAQAVISADRRYVRLSMNAMFSGVTGVQSRPVINNPLIPGWQPPVGP